MTALIIIGVVILFSLLDLTVFLAIALIIGLLTAFGIKFLIGLVAFVFIDSVLRGIDFPSVRRLKSSRPFQSTQNQVTKPRAILSSKKTY